PHLTSSPGYDRLTIYHPVALVAQSSTILVVHPSVPVGSVQELVAYAKANPDKVNFSSGGIGVLPHLIGEWFKSAAAIDIVHVPYRGGGPSINDLVAGQVQMTFEGTSVLLPLIQSGKLRALATTSSKRIPELPDLPTMAESGFAGFVSTSWTGLLARAHTPRDVIDKLNLQINEGLKSAELRSALGKLSNQPLGGTPQDFTEMIKGDRQMGADREGAGSDGRLIRRNHACGASTRTTPVAAPTTARARRRSTRRRTSARAASPATIA